MLLTIPRTVTILHWKYTSAPPLQPSVIQVEDIFIFDFAILWLSSFLRSSSFRCSIYFWICLHFWGPLHFWDHSLFLVVLIVRSVDCQNNWHTWVYQPIKSRNAQKLNYRSSANFVSVGQKLLAPTPQRRWHNTWTLPQLGLNHVFVILCITSVWYFILVMVLTQQKISGRGALLRSLQHRVYAFKISISN